MELTAEPWWPLAVYVDPATHGKGADTDWCATCYTQATNLIAPLLAEAIVTVPGPVIERARLEVASELYHRRNSPMGISQMADLSGNPVRIARDPLVGARPILAPYLKFGMA